MSRNKKVFLGVIPARGGSKGILRKNIKKLAGKPLIQYTFDAANSSKLLDRFIVSTDHDEIINYTKRQGIEVPFKRPAELATDTSKTLDVLIHALEFLKKEENFQPDYIVTLQPTSPMRNEEDIDRAIEIISNNDEADSLVSVIEVPHNFNPYSIMEFDGKYLLHYIKDKRIMIRQEIPKFFARNGAAIYITKYDLLMNKKKIIGEKCLPYFMPKERSVDIDDNYDWKIAELLFKNS
jgi:CMP-N-acetylneuraminic acid synthetase